MMKKLKQEEKKDEEDQNRKGGNKFNILSSKSFFAKLPCNKIPFVKKTYSKLQILKETDRSYKVFHPPGRHITA